MYRPWARKQPTREDSLALWMILKSVNIEKKKNPIHTMECTSPVCPLEGAILIRVWKFLTPSTDSQAS